MKTTGAAPSLAAPACDQGPRDLEALAANLYQDDAILTANLSMDQRDWDTMRNQSPPRPCSIDAVFQYTKFKAKLALDGNDLGSFTLHKKSKCGSLSTTKPGLDLKKDKADGRSLIFPAKPGREALTSLVFNNATQDPSYQRQCLAYQMMRDLNYPAPRCNYVRLCVNREYKGLYVNVEPWDNAAAAHFFPPATTDFLVANMDWTGNESGRPADFYPDHPADVFELKVGSEKALAANLSSQAYADAQQVLAKTPATLPAGDVASLNRLVDLAAFRRYVLWEHLLGHYDGALANHNNHYLILEPQTGLWHYAPWGMDQVLHGPPSSRYQTLRLGYTFLNAPLLNAGLAEDYSKLATEVDEAKRRAQVTATADRLWPFLSPDEQTSVPAAVAELLQHLHTQLSLDPTALFAP